MKFLEKYNADLICANDDINTTTANGKMIILKIYGKDY